MKIVFNQEEFETFVKEQITIRYTELLEKAGITDVEFEIDRYDEKEYCKIFQRVSAADEPAEENVNEE